MRSHPLRLFALLLSATLGSGCLVAGSKYDLKVQEADSLRDALGVCSREKNTLQGRIDSCQKQLEDEKATDAAQSARLRTQDEELRRAAEELSRAQQNYEGTRITREQLISELLEKEKATGKRIQELNARAQTCDQEAERLRREAAAREQEISELRKKVEKPSEEEALRRERDVLVGRVERLMEERRQEEKRRDDRFAALAARLAQLSAEIPVSVLGPTMRVYIPEKALVNPGKDGGLSQTARDAIGETARAAADFPAASVILFSGGPAPGDEIRKFVADAGKLPAERLLAAHREKEKGVEILLVVP